MNEIVDLVRALADGVATSDADEWLSRRAMGIDQSHVDVADVLRALVDEIDRIRGELDGALEELQHTAEERDERRASLKEAFDILSIDLASVSDGVMLPAVGDMVAPVWLEPRSLAIVIAMAAGPRSRNSLQDELAPLGLSGGCEDIQARLMCLAEERVIRKVRTDAAGRGFKGGPRWALSEVLATLASMIFEEIPNRAGTGLTG